MNRLAWLSVVFLSLCVGYRDCQADEFPKALLAEQLRDRIRALMDVEAGVYPFAGDGGRIESIVVVSEAELWRKTTLPERAARELAEQATEYEAHGSLARVLQSEEMARLKPLASVIDDGMLKKSFLWKANDRGDSEPKPVNVKSVEEYGDQTSITGDEVERLMLQEDTACQIVIDGVCVIRRKCTVIVDMTTPGDASEKAVRLFEQRTTAGDLQLVLRQASDSQGSLSVTGTWVTADGKAIPIEAK